MGLNVAAGMTGGQVFLYDPEMRAQALVNQELVEVSRPDGQHPGELRRLVALHEALTGSQRAREILADWERRARAFLRVAPKADVSALTQMEEGTVRAGTRG